jgi:hypothetical protein
MCVGGDAWRHRFEAGARRRCEGCSREVELVGAIVRCMLGFKDLDNVCVHWGIIRSMIGYICGG